MKKGREGVDTAAKALIIALQLQTIWTAKLMNKMDQ